MAIGAKLGIIASSAVSFQNQYSFQFDGTDEYIDLGTATNLQLVDDFSIVLYSTISPVKIVIFNQGYDLIR